MSSQNHVSPIRIRGDLDPAVSRWQWIVKWILAIPHYIVLIFLSIGAAVAWVVALFAILFTEKYPRSLFDYTVGVMRWRWRVIFYMGVLGTDRYPPFSLESNDDYPADLHVDYPEKLHRWLVLVKWWLLALPQYLIVAAISRGVISCAHHGHHHHHAHIMLPLLAILGIIAGIGLLFTGRYPAGVFSFLVGLHRWALRVRAYVGLLTDTYPPFRLDQGAREPEPTQPDAPQAQTA